MTATKETEAAIAAIQKDIARLLLAQNDLGALDRARLLTYQTELKLLIGKERANTFVAALGAGDSGRANRTSG